MSKIDNNKSYIIYDEIMKLLSSSFELSYDEFCNQFSSNQKTPIEDIVVIAPWLLEYVNFKDAVISIRDGKICWESGTWEGGVWNDGIWLDGTWSDGEWRDGIWHSGIWHSGCWSKGVWHDGIWFEGDWFGGTWLGGKWKDGYIDGEYSPEPPE